MMTMKRISGNDDAKLSSLMVWQLKSRKRNCIQYTITDTKTTPRQKTSFVVH